MDRLPPPPATPGLSVEEVADTLLGRMAPVHADDVALVVSRVVPGIVRG
ncbi:hypothetical protein [Blastococcus sp. SYSU DS0973]